MIAHSALISGSPSMRPVLKVPVVFTIGMWGLHKICHSLTNSDYWEERMVSDSLLKSTCVCVVYMCSMYIVCVDSCFRRGVRMRVCFCVDSSIAPSVRTLLCVAQV